MCCVLPLSYRKGLLQNNCGSVLSPEAAKITTFKIRWCCVVMIPRQEYKWVEWKARSRSNGREEQDFRNRTACTRTFFSLPIWKIPMQKVVRRNPTSTAVLLMSRKEWSTHAYTHLLNHSPSHSLTCSYQLCNLFLSRTRILTPLFLYNLCWLMQDFEGIPPTQWVLLLLTCLDTWVCKNSLWKAHYQAHAFVSIRI